MILIKSSTERQNVGKYSEKNP